MIVSVDWDQENQTVTIVCGAKTVQFIYTNLPPGWEDNPNAYSSFIIDYLNGQIEVRTDRRIWLQSKNLQNNSPLPFTDSERLWYDEVADEVVFVDVIVTSVFWDDARQEYIIEVRNTETTNPKV